MAVRVLQLLSNPAVGGTETFVLGVTPRLQELGLHVDVANLWDGGGDIARICQAQGISCCHLDVGQRRFRPHAATRLRRFLKDGRYDVVMAYGLRTTLLLRLVGHFPHRPALVTGLRGIDAWRRWYHVLADRLTQRQMDYFVGVSRSACQWRVDREKTPAAQVLYIPNGVDTKHFCRDAEEWPARPDLKLPDGRLIVSVANLRWEKGHEFLIDSIVAMKALPEDVRFVWVGRGPDEEKLRAQAHDKGVLNRIIFYGAVADVRPLLAHAYAFALPSREEGMPRAVMEAMAMGVPAVATDVGGTGEVVRKEIDGFLVPYGDTRQMADRLLQILDPTLRDQYAANALDHIRRDFGFDEIADKYARLFRGLAANQPQVPDDCRYRDGTA